MAVTVAQAVAKIEVQGDSEAKSKLSSMKGAVQETSTGFKGMLQNALSFAGGLGIFNLASQAVGFLKDQVSDTIRVTAHHTDVMAQTAQAIKSTGDASGLSANQIGDLAESLSKVTDFSQDTVQSGENLLLTFTGIGKDVFPDATKAMLDMSQAMGQDTKSSAIQLGKALNDPAQGLTALTRVGVTFTDGQKQMVQQMVAAGNVAGAQKIILGELSKEFGGSAQAAGQTFGGQMEILKNKLEDAKIKIGTAFMPVLQQLTPLIGNVASALSSPAFINFVTGAGKDLIQAFKDIGSWVKSLNLGQVANQFGQLATQLGLGVPSANQMKSFFSTIGGIIKTVVTDLGNLAQGLANVIKFFKDNQVAGDLLLGVLTAVAAIALVFAGIALATMVPAFIAWAVAAGAAAIATIAATWPILLIGAVIALVVTGIILAIQHWGEIWNWLKGVWAAAPGFFGGIWNAIAGFFGGIGAWFGARFSDAYSGVTNAFGKIGAWFQGVWNGIITDASNAGSNIVKGIANGITGAIHWVTDAIHNVTSWISDHLPHSPAKVGPLKDLHLQGANIVDQIAKGMTSNLPALTSSLNVMLNPMVTKASGATQFPSMVSSSQSAQAIHIHNYIDGKEITDNTANRMIKNARTTGPIRSKLS